MRKILISLIVFVTTLSANEHERLFNIGADPNFEYNAQAGRALYLKECASCHGVNGEKKADRKSAKLSKMSASDIDISLSQYKMGNSEFGGKNAKIMQLRASTLTNDDIGDIITYLKGEEALKYYYNPKSNKDIQKTPTKQGLYLQ